jgi:hypothetical protein
VAVLLSGCPIRVDFGRDGEPKDVGELMQRVAHSEKQISSIKGEAKLKIDSKKGSGTVSLFAAVEDPARLHLETLDFFGRPTGSFVSDGERFGLYDANAGRYYTGPATAENVGRFVPIAMAPAELAALLLGRAPRLDGAKPAMTLDGKTGLFEVTLTRGEIVQKLWVKPPEYRVVKSRVTGISAYDLDFDDLQTVGPLTYPRRVLLEAHGEKLALDYKDIALNETADAAIYELTPPANVPVVPVDGKGSPGE